MNTLFRSVEQENFSNLLEKHINEPDAPLLLEGTTGLGKTRAYLMPLLKAAAVGKRVAIILPTRQLIEQLLNSEDLKLCNQSGIAVQAFWPKRHFESVEKYQEHRDKAIQAPVMFCTSASVIIDQRLGGDYNGVTQRDYLLFDEADQLPQVAALQADVSINYQTIRDLRINADTAKEIAEELLEKRHVEAEDRAKAKIILEAIEEDFWFHSVGLDDDGSLILYHKLPGRLLKRIANQGHVAFVSATLSISDTFDDFKKAIGIECTSRCSGIIEPEQHGTLNFSLQIAHEVDSDEWLNGVLEQILDAPKPCLVVTSNFELSDKLAGMYPSAISRKNGEEQETTTQAALRLHEDDKKDTLIAAAAWAGLDTPIIWKSIVIPKIPFERPTIVDKEVESNYINGRNLGIRRMRQVIGRGLRSPGAKCDIIICDPRWQKVESFVPSRFQRAWSEKAFSEGAKFEVVLSKNERSPYLRKEAFKTYEERCYACDFEPQSLIQIEIHHLDPIAEGKRQTTIEDVIPLCANCHRLAHSRKPPLTVDEMKSINV